MPLGALAAQVDFSNDSRLVPEEGLEPSSLLGRRILKPCDVIQWHCCNCRYRRRTRIVGCGITLGIQPINAW